MAGVVIDTPRSSADWVLAANDKAQATTCLGFIGHNLAVIGLRINSDRSCAIRWNPHSSIPRSHAAGDPPR